MFTLKATAILLLFLLVIPLFYACDFQWQAEAAKSLTANEGQPSSEAEASLLKLIEANQILVLIRNSSTYVAAGSVVDVVYELGENGGIRTYANISIVLPIKGNMKPNDILTVWYTGGEFGGQKLEVDYLWPHLSGDTVVLPSVFELKVGMNVLFFAHQWSGNVELLLYLSMQSEFVTTGDYRSLNDGDAVILAETQPSQTVAESSGYGFNWT